MTEVLETRGRVRVEQGEKRIRGFLGGVLVVETTRPLLVWEKPNYPAYYFSAGDVRMELLTPDGGTTHSPSRGDAQLFTISAGGRTAVGGAAVFADSPFESLRSTVRFDWSALDAWFEEDEEVYTHPRDPYTRVDILASSRHVRIEVDGVPLADTIRPTLLFETRLPTRFYVPRTDVRMELLEPSDSVTHCPYKGQAEYWSVRGDLARRDVAWSYRTPLPESQKIAGLLCFYPEKVDVFVDGVLLGG